MKTTLLFLSVFLSASLFGQTFGTGVYDIDGNYYQTVVVENEFLQPKEWMTSNLKVTRYSDGTELAALNGIQISGNEPGWTYYNGDASYNDDYGKFYNERAAMGATSGGLISKNICPNGWHVALEDDWDELIYIFGNQYTAAGPLKSIELWTEPNTGGTNSSNFSALPGGKINSGSSSQIGSFGYWWQGFEPSSGGMGLWYRKMSFNNTEVYDQWHTGHLTAASIRCVNNNPPVGIIELPNSTKSLIHILDLMGRETSFKPNTPLIYVYDDGSIEKVFTIE